MAWEQRWHPLREEWVIIASHRNNRPWSGKTTDKIASKPDYDADCYLCPGNTRVGGHENPQYDGVFSFDNDHPCVGMDSPEPEPASGIYKNQPARGKARVICYSAKHNLTLAELAVNEIDDLLAEWQKQYTELSAIPDVKHILTFENKGHEVGVSNPHPHCQIYANNFVFKTIETEVNASVNYRAKNDCNLFSDIIKSEKEDGRRVLYENDNAIAFVPYFARYAYEVYVAPKASHVSIASLSEAERLDLSAALKDTLVRFDNLWEMSFPYVMVLHQAPTDGDYYRSYHFHIQFPPPLLKPNLLKFLAGPEIGGGNFLSDTSPEDKAAELIAVSNTHFSLK